MGLDMYLLSQINGKKENGKLGVMNGAFPFSIKTDKNQIGYWRKVYFLSNFLTEELQLTDEDNCVDKEMSEQNIINTLDFLDNVINGKYKVDWYWDKESFEQELKKSKEIFTNALKLIKEENARIYYKEWYQEI